MTCGALNHLNRYEANTLDPRSLRICHEMIMAQKNLVRAHRSEVRAFKQSADDLEDWIEDLNREEVECNEALTRIEAELASRGLKVF